MKQTIILFGGLLFTAALVAQDDHKTEHEHVFSHEEEQAFRMKVLRGRAARFRFPQTSWNECSDDPSGNYSGVNCARSRQISVALKDFLAEGIYECVDAGLRTQFGGTARNIHIVHDGILGDAAHSPRSLHAEARAIDIKAFEVQLTNGSRRTISYAGITNRTFFMAFRSCWGNFIKREAGCPYYQGSPDRTGTIGWEDTGHMQHMHTSVPVCNNGRYDPDFFQK